MGVRDGEGEKEGREGGVVGRMLVTVVLRGVEGLAETEGRSRWLEGRGWAGGGWLVMHCANSPRRGSRDSYPRPIIDRSLEKRRTHCAHRASYLAPYTTAFLARG